MKKILHNTLLILAMLAAPTLAQPTTQPNASSFEQDRAAILAMAGAYDVEFWFEETVALKPGYSLHDPDESHARELVVVITNEPRLIQLQHLLVVHGEVVKHWRQDWLYENRALLEFRGRDQWEQRTLGESQAAGTWTQRVFNVDDGPRYEGFGRWEHGANWHAWESNETWRPLPRREASVRDDYQVIIGRNRHLLTPGGWVHEQDNAKVVLDAGGKPTEVLALERGLNTYNHADISGLKPAEDYWAANASFWSDVRAEWAAIIASHPRLTLRNKVDDQPLYQQLFDAAERQKDGIAPARRHGIRQLIDRYVSQPEQPVAQQ